LVTGGVWFGVGVAGLSRGVVKNLKSPNFRFLGFKKSENFTDLKVSEFFLLLSCNVFNKGHIQIMLQ